jgi:hypothetical protein
MEVFADVGDTAVFLRSAGSGNHHDPPRPGPPGTMPQCGHSRSSRSWRAGRAW